MENKKYIKKLYLFSSYDLKAIETFLEEMAAKGLMFVKQSHLFFYFEACKPKKVRFYVDVFDKASIFDTRPEPETEEYIEYCKASGWQHLFTSGKVQYFYTEDQQAPPIQTDNHIRLKLIHKQVMSVNWASWFLMTLVIGIQMIDFMASNTTVENFIKGCSVLLVGSIYFAIVIPQIIRYFYFYIKNKRRLAHDEELFFFNSHQVKLFHQLLQGMVIFLYIGLMISIGLLQTLEGKVLFVAMMIIIVMVYVVSQHMIGQNNSRRVNRAVQIIISLVAFYILILASTLGIVLDTNTKEISYYDENQQAYIQYSIQCDQIPLTLNTLQPHVDMAFEETIAESGKSIFGAYASYRDYGYDENMRPLAYMTYEVIESPFEFIIDAHEEEILSQGEYIEITHQEAAYWKAQHVYELKDGDITSRLVIYEDKTIMMTSDQLEYTAETISQIVAYI